MRSGGRARQPHLRPFSPAEPPAAKYVHPTPSLSAYLQGLRGRPEDHVVWAWPDGMELQAALQNLHAGRCWCGKPSAPRVQWTDGGWACSREHQRAWWKQFEFWHDVRTRVLNRDGWECRACGAELGAQAQVDHIVPVTDGGPMWDRNNLQSLCAECHVSKTAGDLRSRNAGRRRQRPAGVLPLEHYGGRIGSGDGTCPG